MNADARKERRDAAVGAVAVYGTAEYRRGFVTALGLARTALLWMRAGGTIGKKRMAESLAKQIREACEENGVDVPEEAR